MMRALHRLLRHTTAIESNESTLASMLVPLQNGHGSSLSINWWTHKMRRNGFVEIRKAVELYIASWCCCHYFFAIANVDGNGANGFFVVAGVFANNARITKMMTNIHNAP